jgi:cell division protein FtsL
MKFFILWAIAISAMVAIALRVVHERNRGVNIGFEIQTASKEMRKQQELIHQYRIQRAALLDPKRLRPTAVKLGLRSATADEVVPMPMGVAYGK